MKPITKSIFFLGALFVIYGYLCRAVKIYFFWDSKAIGWIILATGLILYLLDLNKVRKTQGKKTIWVKIGIAFLLFGLIIFPFVVYMLKTSEAYQAATEYLSTDSKIKEEVGNVKGFSLIPTGEVQTFSINDVESGEAVFFLTIKGDRKYKDVTVTLKKTPHLYWMVTSVK